MMLRLVALDSRTEIRDPLGQIFRTLADAFGFFEQLRDLLSHRVAFTIRRHRGHPLTTRPGHSSLPGPQTNLNDRPQFRTSRFLQMSPLPHASTTFASSNLRREGSVETYSSRDLLN